MAFRITGILNGPLLISETTQLEPITWNDQRPDIPILNFNETLETLYSEDNSAFAFSIYVSRYYSYRDRYWGSASLDLTVNFSANLDRGFIETGKITFTGDCNESWLNFFELSVWPGYFSHAENLSTVDYKHFLGNSSYKGYIELEGVDNPRQIHFAGFVDWVIGAPRNQTELLNVSIEIIYYDGQAYRKIIQPFILKIESNSDN
jgi:hypothetical protein